MAGEDMGVPQPPAVARAGTWSRHVAPQGQRESGKENARTTSEATPRHQNVLTGGIHIPCVGWIGCLQSCGFSLASLVLYVKGMVWFTISK